MKQSLLFLLAFTILGTPALAQTKQMLKPNDAYKISALSDPQLSPDGKWVSYSLSDVDTAKNKRTTHLWMQSWDGKESVQLTHGDDAASTARWSPDGKYLSFMSSRADSKNSQVWVIDRRGGEGRKLTNIKGNINSYAWSPDATKLLMVITDPEFNGKEAPKTPNPIQIDRYHFKQDGQGYLSTKEHSHLYIYDIEKKKLDTLTRGDKDEEAAEWSPDGKQIVFTSNRTADPDYNANDDIYVIDAKPGAKMQQLTIWTGTERQPHWSPDGKHISYLRSTSNANYIMYDQSVLFMMDADGKNNIIVTEQLDRGVSSVTWTKDSQNIAFLVGDDRLVYMAQYNLATKAITTINKGMYSFSDVKYHSPDNWVVRTSNPYLPPELFALENGKLRQLTFHQKQWLSGVKLAHVEPFQAVSKDGNKVSSVLYLPDSSKRKNLPLIAFIHGGPTSQDDYSFALIQQTLASNGYAVVSINYRGSLGRGINYTKVISGDWGNKEVLDILGTVDELVKQKIADPNRLGIGGWSYGGILTDYTIATTTRFKAACSGAGTASLLGMYGIDQYILQYDNELGVPWKNVDKYLKLSYPFLHADRIKTPTLFMVGQRDFNVPAAGSEQMYQALRTLNVPTELIVYPNQFHGLSVPTYQVDRVQRYLDWYGKYLLGKNKN
ncbi:S9 family peptidase [Mucilaginibacter terrae]|uniref:Dipeptidyl aminopeptidase/acylaminoacyl peptidase n=1 Tax=Mucilaginibacter terrae TaxID=1955052 RepID=A0ABU3GPR1_9SPHI|nr:S9 family peptidase [Mucilaginibacter terrae]MDT3401516.1 dipeptidyl aminopeptidase/acylaminoacyl peptidase [Mucilaginibacter terrae]